MTLAGIFVERKICKLSHIPRLCLLMCPHGLLGAERESHFCPQGSCTPRRRRRDLLGEEVTIRYACLSAGLSANLDLLKVWLGGDFPGEVVPQVSWTQTPTASSPFPIPAESGYGPHDVYGADKRQSTKAFVPLFLPVLDELNDYTRRHA